MNLLPLMSEDRKALRRFLRRHYREAGLAKVIRIHAQMRHRQIEQPGESPQLSVFMLPARTALEEVLKFGDKETPLLKWTG